MPKSAPGVDAKILHPRNTWSDNAATGVAATKLRDLFHANYEKQDYALLGIPQLL